MSINTPAPASPDPADPPHPVTGPAAARARVHRLHQRGNSYKAIATAAGLVPATVRDLAYGRRRSARGTAAAILSMNAAAIPRDRVDAGGTRLRLRALHVMGHGCARIARALDVSETAIQDLVRGDVRTVSPKLRDKVITLYDAWWDKRAPERTRFERGAATAARKRAIAGNWCAGAGLDDDQLDVPGYRPSQGWKPARGTGIAADVRPPATRTGKGGAHDHGPPDPPPDQRDHHRPGTPRPPRPRPRARRPGRQRDRPAARYLRRHPRCTR